MTRHVCRTDKPIAAFHNHNFKEVGEKIGGGGGGGGWTNFVCFDSLRPSKHFFQLRLDGSIWVEQVLARINVACSMTERSDARTHGP